MLILCIFCSASWSRERSSRDAGRLSAGKPGHSLNVQSLARICSLMKRSLALLAALGLIFVQAGLAQGEEQDVSRGRAGSEWTGGQITQLQDQGWGNQFSPGQAREAVKEGRTVPLSRIFQTLKREYGGYQLGADLYSQDTGGAVYRIDWLSEDGRKVQVTVDARTGAVLERRGG